MVKKTTEKSYGGMVARTSGSELSENKPRQNFHLGDITWVKHGVSSWWPAQVIDEASVSSKPKKRTSHDVLVRLYGTCQYLYVDPWKSNMEFEMILKQENKTAMEAFHKVLQKELTHFKSPSDHDEESVSTKGLKDKTHKKASVVRDKKGPTMGSLGTPVDGKEGLRLQLIQRVDEASSELVVDWRLIQTLQRDLERGVTNLETKDYQNTKHNSSSPSRDAAMEGSEQHSARQIKIMQKLGLVAPPGSPFKGFVAAANR